jgi:adenylyltransferase/sulfurtransferase
VFDPARGGPCYRCLFPTPPAAGTVPGCGEAGVLGAVCGVIGSLQALEAIKLVTGLGQPLRGRLLTYDALNQEFKSLQLAPDPACPLCGPAATLRPFDPARYAVAACPAPLAMPPDQYPLEISVTEANRLLTTDPGSVRIIDVREAHELAICRLAAAEHIPMRQIPEQADALPRDRHLLILCHAGGRSRRVTDFLRAQGLPAVTNIAGGIDAWAQEIDPSLARY